MVKTKPFISIDITNNKNNEQFNGTELVVKTVSTSSQQMLENAQENTIDLIETAKFPLPLRIIKTICGATSLIIISALIEVLLTEEDAMSFAEAYQNAPWLFWLTGVCAIIWAILFFFSKKKEKETLGTEEADNTKRTLDSIIQSVYCELDVPSDAKTVDILGFTYKIKNGVPVAKEVGLNSTAFINVEFKAFIEDANLILADLENKYAFPLSELKSIKTVKKHIAIPDWNKDTAPNKGKYKQYKLTTDRYGCVHMKSYYILEFVHNNEDWGIYFPNYEISVFESLTGLTKE